MKESIFIVACGRLFNSFSTLTVIIKMNMICCLIFHGRSFSEVRSDARRFRESCKTFKCPRKQTSNCIEKINGGGLAFNTANMPSIIPPHHLFIITAGQRRS